MIHRRGLLTGLAATLAAPAIVRTPGLLMPIRPARNSWWVSVYNRSGLCDVAVLPAARSDAEVSAYAYRIQAKWGVDVGMVFQDRGGVILTPISPPMSAAFLAAMRDA